jgi:hypothetical protein
VGEERGSVTPLVAVLVLAVGGLVVAFGRLGAVATGAATAQAAADAAALAGAADGEGAARQLAADNGAVLERYEADGAAVEVLVRAGRGTARARAVAEGGSPGSAASVAGLTPEMQAALAAAADLLGVPAIPITSGWRSTAQQAALWANRATNPFPVARPGTSAHERGTAVDVPRTFAPRLAAVAGRVGLCRPWPDTDPVHFELCRRAA